VVILLAIFIYACLGLLFALCARDRVRTDGPFASPAFVLVTMLTSFLVVPITFYLYAVHPAWSWMYLVDPRKVPGLALVPIVVGHAAVLLGGFYVGALLLRADRRRVLVYAAAGCGAAAGLCALLFANRLGTYATYAEWAAGHGRGLMDVKLGYALIALLLAFGAAAGYVANELVRDARRVRVR
jgi:hypothetical protein